ncbi:Protein of unknown function [Lactobacillus equicursoris 66c]|uniref:Uncharacterized protein n=1 Tax=Lactobacillus equicursoris 66c TaxID=872326 RepID=K0NTI9_9LACO|nr:Protein of unknown function [Lactobacillus equicursoris 66c]CCK83816.1 Protein of unknown function [Lactobacillus equicursoris 66c]
MATVNPATLLSKSIDGWLYLLVTWLGKKKASTLGVKAIGKHKLVDRSGNYFIRTNQAKFYNHKSKASCQTSRLRSSPPTTWS